MPEPVKAFFRPLRAEQSKPIRRALPVMVLALHVPECAGGVAPLSAEAKANEAKAFALAPLLGSGGVLAGAAHQRVGTFQEEDGTMRNAFLGPLVWWVALAPGGSSAQAEPLKAASLTAAEQQRLNEANRLDDPPWKTTARHSRQKPKRLAMPRSGCRTR